MRYHHESAQALRLRLYRGSAAMSRIKVIARGTAFRREWEANAAVIGSSHRLEYRLPDLSVTEVLACKTPPGGERIADWKLGDPPVEVALDAGCSYRFQAHAVDWREGLARIRDLRQLVDAASRYPSEAGLAYMFPAPKDESRSAETLVWVALSEGGIRAQTAHCYPGEGLVVLSTTELDVPNAVPARAEEMELAPA